MEHTMHALAMTDGTQCALMLLKLAPTMMTACKYFGAAIRDYAIVPNIAALLLICRFRMHFMTIRERG